jgi:hypothetical protein
MSPAQHPYVLCTTSPSTEREIDGGEWSFIAPLSIPFAAWASEQAYHCLRQVQGTNSPHLHIHASAVSPQGNFVALLDSNGHICLIPIRSRKGGGMVTNDSEKPIEVKETLGRNEGRMAALRFNPSGTKLYGTNWNGHVVVVQFPRTIPAEIRHHVRQDPSLNLQASPFQRHSNTVTPIANRSSTPSSDNLNLSIRDLSIRGSYYSVSNASMSNASEAVTEFSASSPTGLGVTFGAEDPRPPMEDLSQSPSMASKRRSLSSWKWPGKSKNPKSDRKSSIPSISIGSPRERPQSPMEPKR